MIAAAALPPLCASDDEIGTLLKVLLFVAVAVIALVNAAVRKGRALLASHRDREGPSAAAGTMRSEVFDRARPPDEASSTSRTAAPAARAPAAPVRSRPSPGRERATEEPTGRRKGLVADAHVEVASRLPTADDMPGAHSAHDHVHLTEIGADRGTVQKHPGARPTEAATVARRSGRSGFDLLRARDLGDRDRVRAGILWAEVFGPPRSRVRR